MFFFFVFFSPLQLEASKKPKLEPSSQVKSASSLVARAFGSDVSFYKEALWSSLSDRRRSALGWLAG